MINQYRFEDEEDVPGTKDIFLTVDNPESHVTTIETFITYRVLTKVWLEPLFYNKDLLTKYHLTVHLFPFRNPRLRHQTTRSEFDSSEYEVRRRYQDFFWLKGKLEEAHPTLIVHVGELKRIEERMTA